jgi:hypothetical protein
MASLFSLGGVPVAVEADAADRAWLAGFGGCDERPEASSVAFRVAFEAARGPLPRVEEGTASRVAFALDAEPLRLPVASEGDLTRVWDEPSACTMDVTDDGRATRIRYAGERGAARLLLLRVIREYAHNQSLAAGDLILHAAAVVQPGGVLAIAGRKGAGKTTLALRLMQAGALYLSNDRIRIGVDGRTVSVPTVVTLRPGTRALFPALEARLLRCGDYRRDPEERAASSTREDAAGLRLSPMQLCAAFGQTPSAGGPLASILFLDPAGGDPRPLDAAEAVTALEGCLVGHGSGVYASDLFRPPGSSRVTKGELKRRCAALAGRFPCVMGMPAVR